MLKRFRHSQARSLLAFSILLTLGAAQTLPRVLSPSRATVTVGGCSSGMCSTEANYFCPQSGDACGSYEQCTPDPEGTMLCNPAPYCSSKGCTLVHGAACY